MIQKSYDKKAAKLDAHIAQHQTDGVVLAQASTLKPQPVRWLWPGWLAKGKFHILAGVPGQGKTTLAMGFAAAVSSGGAWPDGSLCAPGRVLIWSGEDDPSDTLTPRLLAAGADLEQCHFVQGIREGHETRPFDPACDILDLQATIAKIGGVGLLICDPVSTAIAGDSHKNAEVRRGLQPLVDLSAQCGCAALGITHFSKVGQNNDPQSRVIGSIAFAAVARVVMVAGRIQGEDGAPVRALCRAKSNLGPDDGGFEYFIEQSETTPGINATRCAWGKSIEGTARDILREPDYDTDNTSENVNLTDLIREELADGIWTPVKIINTEFIMQGYSKKQIWTALNKIKVTRKKSSLSGGWYVALNPATPDPLQESNKKGASEDSEDSKKNNRESWKSSGQKGHLREGIGDVDFRIVEHTEDAVMEGRVIV